MRAPCSATELFNYKEQLYSKDLPNEVVALRAMFHYSTYHRLPYLSNINSLAGTTVTGAKPVARLYFLFPRHGGF